MNFTWFQPSQPKTFGTVGTNSALPSDLENMKASIVKTSRRYREEISKYRELTKLNQHLSNGYLKNIEAMVDVTRVLNYYVEIFSLLKDEFAKNDQFLNASALKPSDIENMEKLTKGKISLLNEKFMQETEKLKKIYMQYNKTDEITRIAAAQNGLMSSIEQTEEMYKKFNQVGGRVQRKKHLKR